MTSTFQLKDIFDDSFYNLLCEKYNFNAEYKANISKEISNVFRDFIILILSENNSYSVEERNRLYNEAIYNLQHTSKLLKGMPHPASSMSYKLLKMSETLKKVTSGSKKEKSKANRFIEKNLIRKFILFWDTYNEKKFLSAENKINYNVCECFLDCSNKISSVYPEIEWFKSCEIEFVESIFENI
ncbi:MAG: hypothetical protein CMQ85_00860 [Gammaproteobacteria bacterium]|nr:hypothetical protein [Gammaproteobacteria bacterium]